MTHVWHCAESPRLHLGPYDFHDGFLEVPGDQAAAVAALVAATSEYAIEDLGTDPPNPPDPVCQTCGKPTAHTRYGRPVLRSPTDTAGMWRPLLGPTCSGHGTARPTSA